MTGDDKSYTCDELISYLKEKKVINCDKKNKIISFNGEKIGVKGEIEPNIRKSYINITDFVNFLANEKITSTNETFIKLFCPICDCKPDENKQKITYYLTTHLVRVHCKLQHKEDKEFVDSVLVDSDFSRITSQVIVNYC